MFGLLAHDQGMQASAIEVCKTRTTTSYDTKQTGMYLFGSATGEFSDSESEFGHTK